MNLWDLGPPLSNSNSKASWILDRDKGICSFGVVWLSLFGCRKESEESESERVKMESRGKLINDKKVKFVGPMKSMRWREKTCGSGIYINYQKTSHFLHSHFPTHFPMATKRTFMICKVMSFMFDACMLNEDSLSICSICMSVWIFQLLLVCVKKWNENLNKVEKKCHRIERF